MRGGGCTLLHKIRLSVMKVMKDLTGLGNPFQNFILENNSTHYAMSYGLMGQLFAREN